MATQYSNKPIVTDGLVYALDFGNPKSYVSGSTFAYNLTYSNVTSSVVTGSSLPIINNLAQFTGSQYVDTNIFFSGLQLETGNGTVMFVLQGLRSSYNTNTVFSQHAGVYIGGNNNDRIGSMVSPTQISYGGNGRTSLSRVYNGDYSTLKHFTFRLSSGSLDCFVNGIPVSASVYGAIGPSNNDSTSLKIGSRLRTGFTGEQLSGSLGLFQIYNRPLTSDEIWNNYQLSAPRYGLGPLENKPYNLDENAYLFLQSAGITDPIITGSIDTFVRGLKSNNLWDKMIAIYPFVGTGSVGTNLTGSHKWNLKEPSLVTYPLSFTGSWNGSISGSAPSGSNTNISTQVAPSTYYPFFNTQSAHISILSYDTPVSSSYLMGTGMTEDLAISTLAGDYGTPAAAYSVRKVRTAYSGALMDVRRSIDNVTQSIGYVDNGDLDTGSLLDWTIPGRNNLPGEYEGLAAAYSLRRVSASYDGPAIQANNGLIYKDIGFDADGNLDTGSLIPLVATGSNVPLDSYSGLAAAYSLRKVVSTYTGDAIEVQSGSVSQSIGFDSIGNLDTGSLLTFVGSGDGFVKTWYDQSGNNYHATQSVASNQPQIVNGGSVILENGKPSVQFDGSDDYLYSSTFSQSQPNTIFAVLKQTRNDIGGETFVQSSLNSSLLYQYGLTNYAIYADPTSLLGDSPNTNQNLHYALFNGLSSKLQINNSTEYSGGIGAGNWNNLRISGRDDSTRFSAAKYQEIIIFSGDKSSNRTFIENNINAYYNIYTTSSTSTENAFVSTWYDQSGNNRHATQTATGSQPLIVSSGSLVTENGKPALRFDGVNDYIESPYFGGTTNDQYFVTNTADTQFKFPRGSTGYGFVAQSGSTSTNLYISYGTPTLYVNSISQSVSTRDEVYNALAGYKLSIHQNTDLSTGWDYLRFGTFISAGPLDYSGSLQEWLIYSSSVSASRPLIENNINNYYNIYTGSNHGFVARWYDQSGNNRHATQTTTTRQPLVVSSGSVITESTSSKPALNFNGTADYFTFTPTIAAQNIYSAFTVVFPTTESSNNDMIIAGAPGSTGFRLDGGATPSATITRCSQADILAAPISGNIPTLATFITTNSDSKIYTNNILRGTGGVVNPTTPILSIGSENGSQLYKNKMQEVVFYTTDQTTNREAVEYGINNYYNIYTQPTNPTFVSTSSFTIQATPTAISGAINNRLTSGIPSSGPLGLITVSRTGSNSLTIARNGVTSSFAVPASGALSTGIFLGAINNNGLALGNSPLNLSFASVGTGLTGNDLTTYYRLVGDLQNNLNRPDLDATAFIGALGTLTLTQQQAVDTLVKDLKRFSLWDKTIAIYPFIGGTANTHKFNLKDPRDLDVAYRLTFSGTWTHNISGSQPTDSRADSYIVPPTDLERDSVHLSIYSQTSAVTSGADWAAQMNTFYFGPRLAAGLYATINNGELNTGNTPYSSARGLLIATRVNSNTVNFYYNTNLLRTSTVNSAAGSSTQTLLLGGFVDGRYNSNKMWSFGTVGLGLSTIDVNNLYTAIQKFQTTLGRQV